MNESTYFLTAFSAPQPQQQNQMMETQQLHAQQMSQEPQVNKNPEDTKKALEALKEGDIDIDLPGTNNVRSKHHQSVSL